MRADIAATGVNYLFLQTLSVNTQVFSKVKFYQVSLYNNEALWFVKRMHNRRFVTDKTIIDCFWHSKWNLSKNDSNFVNCKKRNCEIQPHLIFLELKAADKVDWAEVTTQYYQSCQSQKVCIVCFLVECIVSKSGTELSTLIKLQIFVYIRYEAKFVCCSSPNNLRPIGAKNVLILC